MNRPNTLSLDRPGVQKHRTMVQHFQTPGMYVKHTEVGRASSWQPGRAIPVVGTVQGEKAPKGGEA